MVVNMKNPHIFPNDLNSSLRSGMTLRDYFAAKAMQGLIVDVVKPQCDYIAEQAYAMADEMLKARGV
jgi:hypothetical protein